MKYVSFDRIGIESPANADIEKATNHAYILVSFYTEIRTELLLICVSSLSPKITTSSPSVWYSSYVKNFRILGPEELPHGCRSGSSCDSIAINPPVYLFFLLSYATQLGARYIRAELSHDRGFARVIETALNISSEAPESPPGSPFDGEHNAVVINCTGLGARALCQDDAMYPIRGQTLLVRIEPQPDMPPAKIIMHPAAAPAEGGVTYIVPRPRTDRFILGGTKKDNDWSPNPDPKVTNGIIDRCRLAWPALKRAEIEVLSTQVGLRPGRRGGARVEREEIELSKGKTVFVIHQYGHAGAGYQNSIGSAKKVLGLVKEVLR